MARRTATIDQSFVVTLNSKRTSMTWVRPVNFVRRFTPIWQAARPIKARGIRLQTMSGAVTSVIIR